MNHVRSALAGIALASSSVVCARAESPDAFLRRIYAPFFTHDADASSSDLPTTAIYDAHLVALMDRDGDLADARGEVPAIDGEPLCDCQEMCGPLKAFSIRLRHAGRTRWIARVRFVNCGVLDVLTYRLVPSRGEWRVADIGTQGKPSLVGDLATSILLRQQK